MAPHPVVHFEIGCHDAKQNAEFFGQLFDWRIDPTGPALMIDTGADEGIRGHLAELAAEWGTYITVYVEVADLEASIAKAEQLGGRRLVGPVDVPGRGSFAWLGSPEGHIIGVWKSVAAGP